MPPGGPRAGTPGQTYANRSDLNTQPIRAASGQPYGQRKAQEDSQRAVPLPAARPPTPLSAPSERPNEPITAGAPFGPGRNSLSIQPNIGVPTPPGSRSDTLMILQEAYRLYPSDDLMDMIAAEMMKGGG